MIPLEALLRIEMLKRAIEFERYQRELAADRQERHARNEFLKRTESEMYGRDAIDVEAREVLVSDVRQIGCDDRGDEGGAGSPMFATEQTDAQPHGAAPPSGDAQDP